MVEIIIVIVRTYCLWKILSSHELYDVMLVDAHALNDLIVT